MIRAVHRLRARRYQAEARAGDPQAQFKAGFHLESAGDLRAAESLYRLAAGQGHVDAQVNLGLLLLGDADVDGGEDPDQATRAAQAMECFAAAAGRGDPVAAWNAAVICADHGRDDDALRWLLRAAELKEPLAVAQLAGDSVDTTPLGLFGVTYDDLDLDPDPVLRDWVCRHCGEGEKGLPLTARAAVGRAYWHERICPARNGEGAGG